jgi:AbiU2
MTLRSGEGAVTEQQHHAEKVREIAGLACGDAIEITILIELLEEQTGDGVIEALSEAGADRAAGVVQNALIARLVLLTARAYAKTRDGDLHLRVAAELLNDKTTREIFQAGTAKLTEFDKQWDKCCGDHRLPKINDFRDKFTAHLGEPKELTAATYGELFEFGAETAKCMELLALGTNLAVAPIDTDPDVAQSPKAFWAPWKAPEEPAPKN